MSVWMILRAGLRQRWRSWLALALLAGVFGGVVTATAAGARRTDTAYPRLLAWSRSPEVMFFFSPALAPAIAHLPFRAVARLPQAAAAARIGGFTVLRPASAEVLAPEDSQIPASMWRRKLLSGRLPDPRRAGEADVSFLLAQRLKLRVGGTLRFDMVSASGRPLPVRLRVVGIDAAPLEFPPQTGTGIDLVWTTPAFYRQQRSRLDLSPAIALRLRGGAAALPALLREARRLAGSKAANAYPLTSQNANTQHSIHLAAVALWLLTGLLAAVGLLTLGQLQARQSLLEATDYTALRSLGVSRRQLLAAGLGRAAIIGTAAGAAAVALAVAA
ncbi:MAG: hypothetical protein J2P30_21705, partial [Actinobacteria bacterium]|nr:hypothetical protein [Actinomycetota bacterium]